MRYTTIIDITELPDVWSSASCRELYLFLVLKSGWHDDDRDVIHSSIRNLAIMTGLTKSAVEHALRKLGKAGLVSRDGDAFRVTKWTLQPKPSPRPRQNQARAAAESTDIARQYDEQVAERQRRIIHAVTACTKEEGLQWIQELEEGKSFNHHGVYIPANKKWTEWLKNQIRKK